MTLHKKIELIYKLKSAERIFGAAANLRFNSDRETRKSFAPIFGELIQAFEEFCEENKFTLSGVIPEQREELFRELKSLLSEQPWLVSPDCLMEFPASVPVRAMLASYEAITVTHWEAFFRTLAGIAYCIRSELEARLG